MSKKKIVKIIMLMFVLISLTLTPAYAWKVGTHVYSANIIIDELRANNGSLEIKPFGIFPVDSLYSDAILTYPDYFRAGAMGPDVFPDIYVGQIVLHPGTSSNGAGVLIETILQRAAGLPTSTSSNMDIASFYANANAKGVLNLTYKKQAIAFAMGLVVHESGDLFGHSYVNLKSGGPWPDWIKEGVNNTTINKVIRHNVIESYIDKKIPEKYKSIAYNSIELPTQFVQDTLVGNGRLASAYESSKDWGGLSVIFPTSDPNPAHFKIFYDIRKVVGRKAQESEAYVNRHKNDSEIAQLDPVLLYHRAREKYMEAWKDDIDTGLKEWVETGERVGRILLQHGSYGQIIDEYDRWADDNLLKMLGAPDAAADTISALGGVQRIIEDTLPDYLVEQVNALKMGFAEEILRRAYFPEVLNGQLTFDNLKRIADNPQDYLKDLSLFDVGDESKINAELGNFATNSKATEQSFAPFYNTLVMAKLNILGYDEGIRQLRYAAGSSSTTGNGYNISLLRDMKSMDVGYTWGKPEELNWFILCQNQEDKTKIFDKIFDISDSTLVSKATIYNFGFADWAAGQFIDAGGSGVSVDYSLQTNNYGAKIGLYKLSDMNNPMKAITSEVIPTGTLKGHYYVAVPFDVPGKYIICIYEGNELLKTSEAFEATISGELISANGLSHLFPNDILLSNMRFGYATTQTGTASRLNIDYALQGNAVSGKTIGLYRLNNDYTKPPEAVKIEPLSGAQGSFFVDIPVDKPGKYCIYVYSGQSALIRSSIFEVDQLGNVIAPDLTVLEKVTTEPPIDPNVDPVITLPYKDPPIQVYPPLQIPQEILNTGRIKYTWKAPESLKASVTEGENYSTSVFFTVDPELLKFINLDESEYEAMGISSISHTAQIDWKLNNGEWHYTSDWDTLSKYYSYDSGIYADTGYLYGTLKDEKLIFDLRNDSEGPTELQKKLGNAIKRGNDEAGEDNQLDLANNTFYFRIRLFVSYFDEQNYEDGFILTPWSDTVAYGKDAALFEKLNGSTNLNTEIDFNNVSSWALTEVQKASDLGLIPEVLVGTDMTKPINREEFCELAVKLYEKMTNTTVNPAYPNPFTDTSNSNVLKAYALGITSGTSETTFSPKMLINREQCAAMIFRAIKASNPYGDFFTTGVKDFPDQEFISSWAIEATKYMSKIGIIKGDTLGNFMPKASTSTQELAGYGMATREAATLMSVRTYDVMK